MSYSSQPALVHHGTWDEKTRAHPAMKWMENYVNLWDRRENWNDPWSDWVSDDAILVKSDGTTVNSGGEQTWKENKELYAPFQKYHHEPFYVVCHETDYGWEMIGQAYVCIDLVGERGAGEPPKVKGDDGQEWDVRMPGAFRFQYRKDSNAKHGGIVLQATHICSDSLPAVMTLMKRGVIKP